MVIMDLSWIRCLLARGQYAVACLACASCGAVPQPSVQAPLEIDVTARNYEWYVRYPGPDGRLYTSDDRFGQRDVHVPTGYPTRLRLRSKDFIYTLNLPRQDAREVAVPEMNFELFFTEADEGEYPLRGDQMCGFSHESLIGTLYVEPMQRYLQAVSGLPQE